MNEKCPRLLSLRPPSNRDATGIYTGGIATLEVDIEKIASTQIDNILKKSNGDFYADFALPLPAQVICLMLGLPLENYMQYKIWADELQEMIFHDPRPGAYERVIGEIIPHLTQLLLGVEH